MTDKDKSIVRSKTSLKRFEPKVRKELVLRGLIDLSEEKDEDYWFYKGEELRGKGSLEKALDAYEKGLKLNPDNTAILFSKGHVLSSLGRYENAVESYLKSIKFENNPEELYMMSGSLEWGGFPRTALRAIEKAINQDPNNLDYLCGKGLILEELKSYEEALVIYDKMIRLEPDSDLGYEVKGFLLHELGRYMEAIRIWDKLIELYPSEPYYWYLKVVTISKTKHNKKTKIIYNEAIKACNEAIEKSPNVPAYWYYRASIFSLKGDKDNALKDLSMAIILRSGVYKEKARKDSNFKSIWDDESFKKMTC